MVHQATVRHSYNQSLVTVLTFKYRAKRSNPVNQCKLLLGWDTPLFCMPVRQVTIAAQNPGATHVFAGSKITMAIAGRAEEVLPPFQGASSINLRILFPYC